MNEKVKPQILSIRASGVVNMLSVKEVQRIAFDKNYHELVCFIEEHCRDYVHFIMTGKLPKK